MGPHIEQAQIVVDRKEKIRKKEKQLNILFLLLVIFDSKVDLA
jgi:hypothetical protein